MKILRIILSLLVITVCAWAFALGVSCDATPFYSGFFKLQLGPSILRLAADFTLAALVIVAAILALTFLFGRFYCAFCCPLGILQDFIGWFKRGKAKPEKNFRVVRYLIAIAAFASLAAGWAIGFKILDPFSIFGRIASATLNPAAHVVQENLKKQYPMWYLDSNFPETLVIVAGVVCLLLIIGLVIWKRRIFCTAICPVGTLLGCCSSHGLVKLKIRNCIHCGRCENVCPAGCIHHAKEELDNERCLRCMNCLAVCPVKCIAFTTSREPVAMNPLRRAFFIQGAAVAAGFAGLAKFATSRRESANLENPKAIVPPGAGSPARLAATCTGCALCVVNCTGNVIQGPDPAKGIFFPHLKFDNGFCEFNCNQCTQICPTGAIRPLTRAAKQRRRIGLAKFDESICVAVVRGFHCGACAEHCLTGALRMVDLGSGVPVPVLNEDLCIGCGGCEYPCPTRPKAIVVKPISVQVEAADPNEFFKQKTPVAPKTDEWLI